MAPCFRNVEEGNGGFLRLALAVAAPPSRFWQLPHLPGTAGCLGRTAAYRELPRQHREQTFIHREETLAQDVAAAPELHPEPAVCGDEGLWGFIAAKPAWEAEKNGEAAGGQ